MDERGTLVVLISVQNAAGLYKAPPIKHAHARPMT